MYLMKNIVGHNLILLLKLKSFNYFNDERILDKKKSNFSVFGLSQQVYEYR